MTTEKTTSDQWARDLVGKVLFHVATGNVGKATAYYDGRTTIARSPINNEPVHSQVLEFENGSTFTAEDPDSFVPMSNNEVAFYATFQRVIATTVKEARIMSRALAIEDKKALMLITAAIGSHYQAAQRWTEGQ